METIAFKMQLLPGFETEYKKRHDEIWPELSALLTDAGVQDYSIFLDPTTLSLFAILHSSNTPKLNTLGEEAIMKKWWKYMADIMETNPDNSPVRVDLQQVFYMK
jgi:L-rhamnose mutarotase